MGTRDDLKKRLKVYYASEGVVKRPKAKDLDRFEADLEGGRIRFGRFGKVQRIG